MRYAFLKNVGPSDWEEGEQGGRVMREVVILFRDVDGSVRLLSNDDEAAIIFPNPYVADLEASKRLSDDIPFQYVELTDL